jgi:hypothetical protein
MTKRIYVVTAAVVAIILFEIYVFTQAQRDSNVILRCSANTMK